MVVNIYLDNKGNVLNTMVDEITSHRPGDVINFESDNTQKVVTQIRTKEHYDYGVIVHVNVVKDSDNLVDDLTHHKVKGEMKHEI